MARKKLETLFLSGVTKTKRLSVPSLDGQVNAASDSAVLSAADGVVTGGEGAGDQVVMRQKAPSGASRDKDKSTKRKSNLNRSLTDEQIVTVGPNESQGSYLFPDILRHIFLFLFILRSKLKVSRPTLGRLAALSYSTNTPLFVECAG